MHLQVLESLLKSWRKDPTNKVLIFTKSVKLLEMLDFHLKSQSKQCPNPDINARSHRIFFSTDLGFLKLDGSTKQSESAFGPCISIILLFADSVKFINIHDSFYPRSPPSFSYWHTRCSDNCNDRATHDRPISQQSRQLHFPHLHPRRRHRSEPYRRK